MGLLSFLDFLEVYFLCQIKKAPHLFLLVCTHTNVTSLPAAALPAPLLQQPPGCESSLPWLPVSALSTGLNACFFFKSLVVGLPYSSIFWQFWLFFVFKFVVLFLVVQGDKVYLPMPPSWLEVDNSFLMVLAMISCI